MPFNHPPNKVHVTIPLLTSLIKSLEILNVYGPGSRNPVYAKNKKNGVTK